MISVVLLGTGNVAKQLFLDLHGTESVVVRQVVGRTINALDNFSNQVPVTQDHTKITDADLYIIAVKDDAISEVSEFLRDKKGLVVHTSGTVDMNQITNVDRGVFYPLQTFSKNKQVNFKTIPICIEAQNDQSLALLEIFANTISKKVYKIDSQQRKKLHLAAVFVNNFVNHMYHIAEVLLDEERIPFELLLPLIDETTDKIKQMDAKDAQTGPARRGDNETMSKHLALLKKEPYKEVYIQLSESIKQVYEKEL